MEPVIDHEMPCKGYQQLTVDNTAGGVSLTVPSGASHAHIACEDNDCRWVHHTGTTVSATLGTKLAAGKSETFAGALADLRFIRTGSDDAELNIHYYGVR